MNLLFFMWWLPPGVDPLYSLWLPIAAFLFAILTQFRVKRTFSRFQRVPTRSGLSGAEVAELLLRSRGLDSMGVVSLLTAFEDRLGFTVDDDEIDGAIFETFGTLLAFVQSKR